MIGIFTDSEKVRLPITYNGLTINDEIDGPQYIYEVNQIAYRTMMNAPVESYPDMDGMEVYDARKVSKLIQITGTARAPLQKTLYSMAQDLSKAFDPARSAYLDPLGHGVSRLEYLSLETSLSENRFIMVRPLQPPDIMWNEYMGLAFPFTINLLAPDPRAYTSLATSRPLTGAGGTITVGGNYPTWPSLIQIAMGGGAGLSTFQMNYNGLSIPLNLTYAPAGAGVSLYPAEKIALVNGVRNDNVVGNVTTSSEWWQLIPGALTMSTVGATNVSSIRVDFNAAWSL